MFRRVKSIEYSRHGHWFNILFPPGFLTLFFITDKDSTEIVGNLTGTDDIPHVGNGESVNGNADNEEDEEEIHM